jgi:hypothetical protein
MSFPSREEAKLWMLSNQLGRRNLTDAVRIELALCKADLLRRMGYTSKTPADGGIPGLNEVLSKVTNPVGDSVNLRKEVADEADVSEGTVNNYMDVKEHGSPEMLKQVLDGALKIGATHRQLDREVLKELAYADDMLRFVARSVPFEHNDEVNQGILNSLEALYAKICEFITQLENTAA